MMYWDLFKRLSASESSLSALIQHVHLKHPKDYFQVSEESQRPQWLGRGLSFRLLLLNAKSEIHLWRPAHTWAGRTPLHSTHFAMPVPPRRPVTVSPSCVSAISAWEFGNCLSLGKLWFVWIRQASCKLGRAVKAKATKTPWTGVFDDELEKT